MTRRYVVPAAVSAALAIALGWFAHAQRLCLEIGRDCSEHLYAHIAIENELEPLATGHDFEARMSRRGLEVWKTTRAEHPERFHGDAVAMLTSTTEPLGSPGLCRRSAGPTVVVDASDRIVSRYVSRGYRPTCPLVWFWTLAKFVNDGTDPLLFARQRE